MLDFKDKLVIVTGAARGIGRGVALEFAKRGSRVIILDILEDLLKKTEAELKQAGHTVWAFTCDLGSTQDVAALGERIVKEIGVPDIIYNNAFYAPTSRLDDIEIEGIEKAFNISVLGYIRIIRAFLNHMIARKSGWIVNTASPNGITPPSSYAEYGLPYNIVKAADISLSQCLAAGLKRHNIGVSVIYPAAVLTGAVTDQTGNAPEEFKTSILKYFDNNGLTPEQAAVDFLDGVAEEKFMVTNYENWDKILVEYAKKGLDPNAVDLSGFQI